MLPSVQNVTPDTYIADFQDFLPLYVAEGSPSADTLAAYKKNIRNFLAWCQDNSVYPLSANDMHMRFYRNSLVLNGYSLSTVQMRMVAARTFFAIGKMLGLISRNPCEDIGSKSPHPEDALFFFYSMEQIRLIAEAAKQEEDPLVKARTLLEVAFMGLEGLRVVELHRMNREDIDWEAGTILVHGKGHDAPVYPCERTFELLRDWLRLLDSSELPILKDPRTPVFVCLTNRHKGGRLSRDALRRNLNAVLERAGLKKKGKSCHALRHSCGTALYEETKDLRLVQEVLRQRDPKVTARYAHVGEKLKNRATSLLQKKIEQSSI